MFSWIKRNARKILVVVGLVAAGAGAPPVVTKLINAAADAAPAPATGK